MKWFAIVCSVFLIAGLYACDATNPMVEQYISGTGHNTTTNLSTGDNTSSGGPGTTVGVAPACNDCEDADLNLKCFSVPSCTEVPCSTCLFAGGSRECQQAETCTGGE